MTAALRFIGLVTALACTGCSYALMRPAPADHAQLRYVDCTSSRLAPAFDTYGVVQGVGLALAIEVMAGSGITGHGGDADVSADARALQVGALAVGAVYLASAIYGYRSADECSDAKELGYQRQFEAARTAATQPPTRAPTAAPRPGCTSDAECKADRLCVDGSCAWPTITPGPATVPAPITVPAPATAPAPTPAASPSPPRR